MKWFGRKAARATGRPFLFSGLAMRFAGEPWPRGYEAQVREAVLSNAVAQRAVRLVSESVAGVSVVAEVGAPTPPPFAAGKRSPSPFRGGILTAVLLERVAMHLLLHGNAFLQVIEDGAGLPAEMFALRPERVTIEADGRGWPAAYVYKVPSTGAGQGTRTRIVARDGLGRPGLIHLKAAHPIDDHYGLGCLGAAAPAVAVHNESARWHKALLDNAARPSGALVYEPGDGAALSGAQYERLKAEMEAQFQGSANAGRPLLLEGGLKWQAMSLTPADMDFAGLKAAAAREIALAFGVPPMLLGLPGDSTYANYKEANRALWRLTVLPMAARILSGIGAGLAAWWPGLRLCVDMDQVTALHEEREALWRAVTAADFLTLEEKREMLGFAPAADVETLFQRR